MTESLKTLVLIRCGETRCALDGAAVSEIAPLPELSHPPSAPPAVEGVLNLGGEAVLVVDLARLLGLTPCETVDPIYRHLVVLEAGSLALLVDRVEDVRQVEDAAIRPDQSDATLNGCVMGEIDLDGSSVHLLDSSRIFLAAERARLAEIRRAEQARLDALETA